MSDNTIDISYLFPIRLRWKGNRMEVVDGMDKVMVDHVFEGGHIYREEDLHNIAVDLSDGVIDIIKDEAIFSSVIESYLLDTFDNMEEHQEK